ncbi:hypothetical protein O7602_02155 [Micromonospora sp. WMMD1128]|uniref:hypothetical protein n=1 Tax=Micromonospora sp. WMMD1128 TaxID=3015150 RepID=UPI00248C2274|nr:hypothetical protein [Micromonospora sp. WMMD1128]WBB74384.1 hypothetical protein O7602_02155 [Micromonospora sp. WMMD1128]
MGQVSAVIDHLAHHVELDGRLDREDQEVKARGGIAPHNGHVEHHLTVKLEGVWMKLPVVPFRLLSRNAVGWGPQGRWRLALPSCCF